jgi:hypothetical protein
MWQSPSGIVQRQCDVPKPVSSLDRGSVLRRVNGDRLKVAEVDDKNTIFSSQPVGNVTVLI